MARQPVRLDINPPSTQIVAQARDTYVAPKQPGEGTAEQLARALSKLRPSLNRHFEQQKQEKKREERDEAVLLAQSVDSALTDRQMIDQGLVREDMTQTFWRTLRQEQGILLGDQYAAYLEEARKKFDYTNGNPAEFLKETQTDFLKDKDTSNRDLMLGFHSSRKGTDLAFTKQAVNEQYSRTLQAKLDTSSALLGKTMDAVYSPTMPDLPQAQKTVAYRTLYATANAWVDDQVRAGMLKPSLVKSVVNERIIQMAVANRDENLLDMLKEDRIGVDGSSMPGLGTGVKAESAINKARMEIRRLDAVEEDRAYRENEKFLRNINRNFKRDMYRKFDQDSSYVPSEEEIMRWEDNGVPDARHQWRVIRSQVVSPLDQPDAPPETMAYIELAVREGSIEPDDIYSLLSGDYEEDLSLEGVKISKAQFDTLLKSYDTIKNKEDRAAELILGNSTIRSLDDTLKKKILVIPGTNNLSSPESIRNYHNAKAVVYQTIEEAVTADPKSIIGDNLFKLRDTIEANLKAAGFDLSSNTVASGMNFDTEKEKWGDTKLSKEQMFNDNGTPTELVLNMIREKTGRTPTELDVRNFILYQKALRGN